MAFVCKNVKKDVECTYLYIIFFGVPKTIDTNIAHLRTTTTTRTTVAAAKKTDDDNI